MESIIQQQQQQQYLPSTSTTTAITENYTRNIVTITDAINSDTTTSKISTTSNATTKNESFHSQNFNYSTNPNKNINLMQQKISILQHEQQQQQQQNDHANFLTATDDIDEIENNKIDNNSINVYNNYNDDDDDDGVSNKLKNYNNKSNNSNTTSNNYEIVEKIKKSSSTTNLRLNFRKSHTCGSLFANCNCDNSNTINLSSTTPTTVQIEPLNDIKSKKILSENKSQQNQCDSKISKQQNLIVNLNNKNPVNTDSKSLNYNQKCSDSNVVINSFDNNTIIANASKVTATKSNCQIQQNNNNNNVKDSKDDSNISKLLKNDHLNNSDLNTVKSDGCILRKTSSSQQNNKTLSNCKKKNRKIFQSYSHPDTNFIFTDENCNPNSSKENIYNNQTQTISTKSGNICVKHPKRSSSPNIGNFTILDIHPEILVKIHKSDPNLKGIEKNSSILKSSQSSLSLARSSLLSIKKTQINSEHKTQPIIKLEENNITQQQLLSPVLIKKSFCDNNLKPFDLNILPKRSLPNLPKDQNNYTFTNNNNHNNNKSHSIDINSTLVNSNSTAVATESQLLLSTINSDLKNTKLESAQKYFEESGILGPNIKAEKVTELIRKTSKIIQDSNFIEHVRKNSKIILSNSPIPTKKNSKIIKTLNGDEQQIKGGEGDQTILKTKEFFLDNMSNLNDKKLQKTMEKEKSNQNFNNFNDSQPQQQQQLINNDIRICNNNSNNINNTDLCRNSNNEIDLNCCKCDNRIKNFIEEIDNLKDIVNRRDNEIHKLKREIHKLKSVLQQTNASRILLNEKNIFQNKHHSGSNQQNLTTPSSSSSSLIKNNQNINQHHHHHHHLQHNQQMNSTTISNNDLIDNNNCKLINGEYNYAGLVGVTTTVNNIEKKLIKAKSHDQDLLKDKNNLENNISCATCISKRSLSYQSTMAPLVVKKQGVSGESSDAAINKSQNIPIPKYEKDFRSKQLIKDAIMDNDFLKNIDSTQVRELVESMYNLDVAKSEFVIREGDVGSHLYVSAEGNFEVIKNDIVLGIMGPGKAFGELAILYNCTRTASIRVLSDDARVWVLDRRIFQQIMMRTGMQRIEENINFLKSVPLLKNLSSDVLAKIADVLEVEFYPAGTYIIRQGASGDTFFLISQGTVKVTQKLNNLQEEKEIRTLQRGDYFGEQALINVDKRTANIIAMIPGVECLTLDRESFNHLIGDLCELKEKTYGDENRILAMKYSEEKEIKIFGANIKQEFPDLKLTDLEIVATLGIGGFGRVELVKCYHHENHVETYALKCLKKKHIIDTRQEEHVFSERTIMLTCKSPFICRLYKTFRDEKYLYMLLEACMGGEVWTMLRDRGSFTEIQTQFITGCVLQAFEYLHSRNIIYRDLKPENLMLNEQGYVKLVDFGFAKHIGNSQKTWTFCGTPEYVAPEIILNKGHDRAVDYWALGILIHELLNGTPPFTANDPMKTYNIILKGIDMIDFPKHMSKSAIMLIKKLCRDVPAERLGYSKGGIEDIKKHKWFQGFDWDSLANLTLIPPFLRPVSNPLDTSYFDKFPADTETPPDETSGWDSDF